MNIKKNIITVILLFSTGKLFAITSNMSHRIMATSPLLYKMIDYSQQQISFEAEPIYMSLYEQDQVNANIILEGKSTLHFNQQSLGDLDPLWINLGSNNPDANYDSQVTFTPSLRQSGMLLHWYENFDHMFVDIKTALVQCTSEIGITEVGGGNGGISGILNAQQAFTQSDWNYGKIGQTNHVVGLDNIEIRFGGVNQSKNKAANQDIFISGFGVFEIPTGSGTKAEWLFEPQVGTNHWGVGLGFEALFSSNQDLKFMIAGNYRYLTPAWETRSFDLINNGQWSRYLGVQETYGLPTAPITVPLPGINYFTQQAYIKGRSELNFYTRLEKQFQSSQFELSYNFFCLQQESIGTIKSIAPGYGIYALTSGSGSGGGITTASTATINQSAQTTDPITSPVEISNSDLNKFSAAQGTYVTNTLAARLEIVRKNIVYGFGAAIEAGLSKNALSTWSVWAKFEYLFDTIKSSKSNNYYDNQTIITYFQEPISPIDSMIDDNFTPTNQIISDQISEHNQYDTIEHDNNRNFLDKNMVPMDNLEYLEQNIKEEPYHADGIENEFYNQQINQEKITPKHDVIQLDEYNKVLFMMDNGLNLHDHQENLEQINNQHVSEEPIQIIHDDYDDQQTSPQIDSINLQEVSNFYEQNFGKEFYPEEPEILISDDKVQLIE